MKRIVLLLATVLLTVGISAFAQDTANMNGTVMDKSGAVIPGAKVTVSNPSKGYNRDLVSDTAGFYSISAIPIGDYLVSAEAPGFEKLVRSGITLQVGQTQRVDLQMTVGQVTQEVTVTGNLPKVQTESAAVSSVITNQQIQNLDLNGRNWVTLATLVPGAVPDNGLNAQSVGVYGNNSISFNGNRMQYNNWEIDGGNNTDEGSASTFNTYPSLDTIAEFRISTSNYGADMGKHAGASIELATKSGTKDFHGDAFEYVRNDLFDANDFFINRNSLNPAGGNAPKTPLKWNDFGYTIGGPVYIPGHYNTDKSKTFFFWSEDWRRYRQGQVIGAGVPSLLERTGDFSQCDPNSSNYLKNTVGSGCKLPTLGGVTYDNVQSMPGFDPQAFTNGTDLINALVPLPNSGPANWTTASSAPVNWRQEQIRIDQNISDKTQAFFRYTQDTWNTVAVPSLWAWASYDTIKTPFAGPGESAVLHITHTFRPNLENEFVAAYTTDHIFLSNVPADSVAGSLSRPSNFQMAHIFPANNTNPLLPSLELCGGLSFCTNEDAANHPWFNSNPIITWKDNVAWVHGPHTTKIGVYLENYRKNEQFGFNTQGALYNGGGGSVTTTNAMADMFLGRIQQYQEGTQVVAGTAVGGYPHGHWQMTDTEPYVQDDWKVTPHLTLNLGVRYYLYTRIHDVSNPGIDSGFLPNDYNPANEAQLDSSGNYIAGTGATVNAYGNGLVQCGHNGIPNGCQLRNTGKNIGPRFGFAWDPFGKGTTSIRGGYGIYYESGNGNEAQTEGGEGNPPVAPSPSAYNVYGSGPGAGYSLIAPPTNGLLVPGPSGFTAIPYSEHWPHVYQYSLSLEHQFAANNLVSLAYVGNMGRDLARQLNINEIPLGVGTENVPDLANAVGTKSAGNGAPADKGQTLCDASGNCNVQNTLIYGEHPSVFFVPYRGYTSINMKQNTAHSNYSSLQASLRHTFSRGLTLQAAYTWSHALDNSSSTYSSGAANSVEDAALNRWYATSDFNRTHVLEFNYIYAMPFFKNSTSGLARQVLGGWQISGIGSFFTGEPVNFTCNVSGYSTGIGTTSVCDTVGKVAIDKTTYNDPTYGPTMSWWNSATITQPQFSEMYANNEACMFGCMGRNALTGPGRNNWDMALEKNFELPWFSGEHSSMQFRLESFNTFNHTQWQYINAGCSGSVSFGGSCTPFTASGAPGGPNVGQGEVNSTWSPRNVQLGLKFIF